jgi:hypothetical protein
MSKKLLIKTGLLLALAALTVLPATAQASTPRYFANGVKLEESNGNAAEAEEGAVYVIGWGTLSVKGETGRTRDSGITCHSITAGKEWNPVGGGAGLGATEQFAVFDCESQGLCEAGEAASMYRSRCRGRQN